MSEQLNMLQESSVNKRKKRLLRNVGEKMAFDGGVVQERSPHTIPYTTSRGQVYVINYSISCSDAEDWLS